MRAPLLIALWVLLAVEFLGGLVIFFARLANGTLPGESLHVWAGIALAGVYAAYQWQHWLRVRSVRSGLDRLLGYLTASSMVATLVTGIWLGWEWWRHVRVGAPGHVPYASWLSGAHNIASMLVAAFVASHVGVILLRERPGANSGGAGTKL
jgi:hypothetical protein